MATIKLPSQAYLRQCFDYDPETGVVTWRVRPLHHFTDASYQMRFNDRFAGRRAGSKRSNQKSGHWEVSLTHEGVCQNYLLHRIIWKMEHGDEPTEIDHISIDGGDNRLANLRACEHFQNMSNTKVRRDNKSGIRGVRQRESGRWHAAINHKGRAINIGRFDTREEAAAAYAAMSRKLHGDFAGQLGV